MKSFLQLLIAFIVHFFLVNSVQDCPLLGRDFPAPKTLNTTAIQNATKALETAIDIALQDGTLENYTSSFSAEIFAANISESLFTYHHSSSFLNATEGVSTVDSDTLYRIGSITKLFSVYTFLIEAGDAIFNEPVTHYIPELAALQANRTSYSVDWDSITIGNLASHMSGIARDYLFDLQPSVSPSELVTLGFPLNTSAVPDCVVQGACNRAESFQALGARDAVYPSSTTPIYNNVAFQLFAYALEAITSKSFPDMVNTDIIQTLGLNNTSYLVPNTTHGAIPFNITYSSWNYSLGDLGPAGNMFSSVNDMARFGKSILNSELLDPAQTRRWMKPLTHTSSWTTSVGAPWEVLRKQMPNRIVDLYTKDGEIGLYESQFALVPDWNIGLIVFQAGLSYNARVIANMISDIMFPAFEEAAREEADAIYAGVYKTESLNSSITITTDSDHPGLGISSWISNGTDMIAELTMVFLFNNTDVRLYPTGITTNDSTVWRAVFGTKQTLGDGIFSQTCTTWGLVDNYRYGGRAMDEFIFTLENGIATKLEPRAFGVHLEKS